ncbi:uncharacterized protein Z518_09517 [Rhinocladiella mackenziei CBS 650.93]|uniref:protein-histidine N-methyltransferase n=1 Tax=Rhinocladiella mackenziei CBS 650.93 TaxID=1442369 RepID=A0A0D2IYT2_9EURO|nr:uncharacterized protein Z518_09517 [Rhinocladiella mackenziei CBS 650.93]KIX01790.1 hypothetical protein Z518_09517 [Rhinocladiella mackenziei CBS 650.93]
MSFAFGFGGDDIEAEDEEEVQGQDPGHLSREMSKYTISDPDPERPPIAVVEPKRHSLEDLLATLPSQISYNTLSISCPLSAQTPHVNPGASPPSNYKTGLSTITQNANETIHIPRRLLFDIRAQLMAETDPEHDPEGSSHGHDQFSTLLSGLENGDLTAGFYEGGFKTWECALDLASLLVVPIQDLGICDNCDWEIVELGAGSAVPSLTLLQAFLIATTTAKWRQAGHGDGNDEHGNLNLTLCDYNEDVLRLCTAPNVLLNYLKFMKYMRGTKREHRDTEHNKHDKRAVEGKDDDDDDDDEQQEDEGEIEGELEGEGDLDFDDMPETLLEDMTEDMRARNISIDFISGGWGEAFVQLIPQLPPTLMATENQKPTNLLILASETIYSPSSTGIFAETLVSLLKKHPNVQGNSARAWVAAKKVYFGVGGGVDEFVKEIERRGARSRILMETRDTGVGRVVLDVTV